MTPKKNLMFLAFVLPVSFVVGILVSLILSLQFQESVELNWLVVVVATIVVALLLTWRNSRDEKKGSSAG